MCEDTIYDYLQSTPTLCNILCEGQYGCSIIQVRQGEWWGPITDPGYQVTLRLVQIAPDLPVFLLTDRVRRNWWNCPPNGLLGFDARSKSDLWYVCSWRLGFPWCRLCDCHVTALLCQDGQFWTPRCRTHTLDLPRLTSSVSSPIPH